MPRRRADLDSVLATLRPSLVLTARVQLHTRDLDVQDAEDLVQDTMLILLERPRRPRHLLAYAKKALISLLIKRGLAARKELAALELVNEGVVRL